MENHIKIKQYHQLQRVPLQARGGGFIEQGKDTYRHYKTIDWNSPSADNLKAAVEFHDKPKGAVTLVHCGFGHRRTWMGISAIQLYAESGLHPTELRWVRDNHVEEAEGEIENLIILAKLYKEHLRRRFDVGE